MKMKNVFTKDLFKGISSPVINAFPCSGVYFLSYEFTK